MAEAFGIGTGIVGVLGLTIQITQVAVQFGLDWKDAPTSLKSFMCELRSLKIVLLETTNFLEDPGFKEAFQDKPSILQSRLGPNASPDIELSTKSCTAELEKVLAELMKRAKGGRLGWERFKWPFLAENTQKSMKTMRDHCQIFNNMLSMDAVSLGVTTLKEMREARGEQREWHNAEENKAILTWISNLSFEKKQTDILSKRHPQTGEWLLHQDRFKDWRNGVCDEPSTLWCPGIPGAGKSVMTSIVIEHLQTLFSEKEVSVSYIYCDYKDRKNQTTVNLISSLVKQIVLQQEDMPQEVKSLYSTYRDSQSSLSLEDLSRLLSSFSNHFRRSFILVDALDEHIINDDEENPVQFNLLNVLLNLHQQRDSSRGFTLFFTSRENGLIEERLAGCARLNIHATEGDIESYLRSRIYDPAKFKFAKEVQDNANLGNLIISSLVEKARGMFLLPRLHLDRLGCQTNIRDLRKALKSLPTKLDETYDGAMTRIQDQIQEHSKLALSALSWISNALRPLRLDELQHALAVQRGDQSLDEEALVNGTLIISVSAGLITLDNESETIRLVHFTVEEYFRKMKTKWFPDADSQIAETCLTYLSFDAFESGRCLSDQELEARLQENCFLRYAACNWGHHAHRAEEHTVDGHTLEDLALSFLTNHHKVACSNQIMRMPFTQYRGYSQRISHKVSGLHLTAWFGLTSITKRIIEGGKFVDTKDDRGQTPLSWAAEKGHEAVVKLFVDRPDVTADSKDSHSGQTPLSAAAESGHEAVVKLLVDRPDVTADSKNYFGQTPLLRAAGQGQKAVVKLLMDRLDVTADFKDSYSSRTPLSYAAESGHEAVVKLLVDRPDVTADSKDRKGRTPLLWAAWGGHEAVVKLLVDRPDVTADFKDSYSSRAPLLYAAKKGHEAVVKLLVDRPDVTVDSKDELDRTPLSWAAGKGHKTVVKLLLDRPDITADSKDNESRTPLSWAAIRGHEAVVKLLVDRPDVTADSEDNESRTPLSWAAANGHEAVVKLLVDRPDVTADSKDDRGQTPLSWAAERGHEAVVKLLVDRPDVTADSKDNYGQTPLSWAAKRGHEVVVKLLVDRKDVMTDSKDCISWTPLSYAAEGGHEAVVKLLLVHSVTADYKDKFDQTPLSYAAEEGHTAVVKLLLKHDVTADSKDKFDRTPLSWATERGHEAVVKLLLEHNVTADFKDNSRTPLSYAAAEGHTAVVKLLLKHDVTADSKDRLDRTPLSWAAEEGHEAVVKLLVDRKDVMTDSKDCISRTPLSYAAEGGHEAVVRLLQEKLKDLGVDE